jgi:hypothetical protein
MNSHGYIYQTLSSSPQLTSDQKNALKSLPQLKRHGFTENELRHWQGMFYSEHEEALLFLSNKGYSLTYPQ